MSEVNKHISIPKDVAIKNDLDYAFLREKGQQYIEGLAGSVWTDYNEHDPGITLLEMLCYAITDLGARISLPLEDILTAENDGKAIEDQFFTALQILPSKPVTENDYRKLFIDIDGVKNCWLQKCEKTVHVNCKDDELSYNAIDFKDVEDYNKRSFILNGLYELIVDFDESVIGTKNESGETITHELVKSQITTLYHQNRNLCEDLVKVSKVDTHRIQVCASIELEPETDEEYVHAKIQRTIEKYFSPDLWFYSLQQMFAKGYTSDQIFEGPVLQNGFLDPLELTNARLRTEVRLSDLMQIVMNIEGVKVIKEMSINDCDEPVDDKDLWLICVDPGKKPRMCQESAFSYYKGVLPVNINLKKVIDYKEQLEAEEKEKQELASVGMKPSIPKGDYLFTGDTTTIQNDFPETYGIGQVGLPGRASTKRKAQAKQLKAYLLFFDQIFASYFAHLKKVKDLLSVDNSLSETYFTQAVKDIKGFEELVENYSEDESILTKDLLAHLDDNISRKNKLLDHLLARFAEKFSEYSFLMKALYGQGADKQVIRDKEKFLSEYGEIVDVDGTSKNKGISNWRGTAFNYFEQEPVDLWDTINIAGVQKRIARLCGVKDFSRRDLSSSYVEIYKFDNIDGKEVYRWRIKNAAGNYILSATVNYAAPRFAEDEMYQSIVKVLETNPETITKAFRKDVVDETEIGNFEIQRSEAGKYSFDIINTNADPQSVDRIIARQFLYYDTLEELKEAILEIIRFFTDDFVEEGMFLLEHILLRPNFENGEKDDFMPICTNNCESCEPIDPYSYRVTIVLPGWTYRFGDMDFRNFMEELIRKELPAHVLARICWVGHPSFSDEDENDMVSFETAYKEFLLQHTNIHTIKDSDKPGDVKKREDYELVRSALIDVMTELNTIYPNGRLIDCDDEEDSLEGRIILGRTNIGNL